MLAYHEHYTLEDYQQWKGDWELIHGMPYAMSPAPSLSHQVVAGNILTELTNKIRNTSGQCAGCHALMKTDWEVSHDTVVRPDIMVVCGVTGESVMHAPVMIFEVSSRSTAKRDEQLKFELYEKEGVAFYILVYPQKKLAKVFQWLNGSYRKMGDFTAESLALATDKCRISLELAWIWRQ